jgi:hypothetical protein
VENSPISEGQVTNAKPTKDLHIDNFPVDVKNKARKKALDTHPSFKQWVIDLFNAATTGEPQNGISVLISLPPNGQRQETSRPESENISAPEAESRRHERSRNNKR